MTNKSLENIKLGAGCLFAPILLPLTIIEILVKEEAIDRITGKRQKMKREYEESRKRFNQETQRMDAHKALYTSWAEKVTPILEGIYGERPELMEEMPIERTTLQRWGASFWDFPSYETRAIKKGDFYIFEDGPQADEKTRAQYVKIDDNNGKMYTRAEATSHFTNLLVSNVLREDTEVLREGLDTAAFMRKPYRGVYRELAKKVKSTKRKSFIQDIKERTGIDLRKR